MVKVKADEFHKNMHKNNIRNVIVLSTSNKDKTSIIDAIAPIDVDEAQHSSSSPNLCLHYKLANESLNAYKDEKEGRSFKINIIDFPRHTDPREVSIEMCLADGAMLVVDSCEGITSDVETLLHQAMCERIIPALCVAVNMMDRKHFLDYQDDGEKVYQALCNVITNANLIVLDFVPFINNDIIEAIGFIKRAMIVAPPIVIDQWEEELTKVDLRSSKFTKAKDTLALKTVAKEGGILVTSYDMYSNHEELIMSEVTNSFYYVIADEGHRIKNNEIDTSKALLRIKCHHKIMLTGTPIQNNILEFHTLMSFCNPTLLGSSENFEKDFAIPIDRVKYKDLDCDLKFKSIQASKALREIINPFVLRRTKDLLKATGRLKANKYEVTVWLQISPLQMKLYEALTQDRLLWKSFCWVTGCQDICMHPNLVVIDDACNEGTATVKLKKNLMRLLAHNLPTQSKEQEGQKIQVHEDYTSSRLEFVLYLLPKLIQDGHKILVFSYSPRMLEILQGKLATIIDKEMVIRMDGTTSRKERMHFISEFQSNVTAPLVFLMTTKVGGLGITLTKASRVLILDPSENPSDDNQAVDRAYQIGQEKYIVVYRLIMCGTIEEHIYREQILKVEMAYAVLKENQVKRGITKQEGFVLSMPREGFSVSRTHRQLTETHGCTFDRSISTVVNVFNHSVIFSLKEDLVVADADYVNDMKDHTDDKECPDDIQILKEEGYKVKETSSKKEFIETRTKIPRHLIPFFKSKGKTTEVKRASGYTMVQIMCTDRPDLEEVVLMGYIDETMKAKDLIQDIVKTKSEEIFVRRDKTGLIIGKDGVTIRHIQDLSGAHVQVIDRKYNLAEKTVIITGTNQQINEAKQMIMNAVKGWKP